MGVDWGDVRTGVALSDPLGISVSPLTVLQTNRELVKELTRLISEHRVTRVVVGLPTELSGEVGDQAKKVLTFVDKLKLQLKAQVALQEVQVSTWDERLTTQQAERMIVGSKLKNRARSEALDKISAAIILQSFLAANPTSY